MKLTLFTTQKLETFPSTSSMLSVLFSIFTVSRSIILSRILLWAEQTQLRSPIPRPSLLILSLIYSHHRPLSNKEIFHFCSVYGLMTQKTVRHYLIELHADNLLSEQRRDGIAFYSLTEGGEFILNKLAA